MDGTNSFQRLYEFLKRKYGFLKKRVFIAQRIPLQLENMYNYMARISPVIQRKKFWKEGI